MISVEFSEGITETLDILNHMEKQYLDKIPKKLINFLEQNGSKEYKSDLEHSKKLNELNLKEKTKDILAAIYLNYWCTPQEKVEYEKVLMENEKINQEILKAKYNIDNIFKNKDKHMETMGEKRIQNNDNVQLIKNGKIKWYKKIISKILSVLKQDRV